MTSRYNICTLSTLLINNRHHDINALHARFANYTSFFLSFRFSFVHFADVVFFSFGLHFFAIEHKQNMHQAYQSVQRQGRTLSEPHNQLHSHSAQELFHIFLRRESKHWFPLRIIVRVTLKFISFGIFVKICSCIEVCILTDYNLVSCFRLIFFCYRSTFGIEAIYVHGMNTSHVALLFGCIALIYSCNKLDTILYQ